MFRSYYDKLTIILFLVIINIAQLIRSKGVILNLNSTMKFSKELYSKTALIKAAYNFTDRAYVHLDSDENYYFVEIKPKQNGSIPSENEFINEMLTQAVRYEVYRQTKNVRELLIARAIASSVVDKNDSAGELEDGSFDEQKILKDWFEQNESTETE